jgi:DNA-binding transcriptional regulator GbsR (MarR family)
MAQRVSLPGDRRDYYEVTPRSFEQLLTYRIRAIHEFVRLAEEGLAALDADDATARERLEKMKEFYQFFLGELQVALDHWRKHETRIER